MQLKGGKALLPIVVEALDTIFQLNKVGQYYSEDPKSLVKNAIIQFSQRDGFDHLETLDIPEAKEFLEKYGKDHDETNTDLHESSEPK